MIVDGAGCSSVVVADAALQPQHGDQEGGGDLVEVKGSKQTRAQCSPCRRSLLARSSSLAIGT